MVEEHELRRWRAENKVTLAALAGTASVTASHLSEIERGLNTPSLELTARLSRITGIPMDRFVKQSEAAQ